ncbi:MAG TPA: prolyl oligopeptidase family serine peptidase [Longimicrobium sp.]|nr:prolyl oligopeptidase family serine peptidase [Longimicrobium sp.]
MRVRVLTACAIVLAHTAAPLRAQAGAGRDGTVAEEVPYRFTAFAELPPDQREAILSAGDSANYERARVDRAFTFRKVRYWSDGLRVVGYLYLPVSSPAARPVIVYNRGSWIAGDQAPALLATFHRLASAGFMVVAPQYRGSDGGEGRDELGGADVADVLNAVALARRLPGADTGNVFMYGESRGGMMTYQAIRDGAPIRAAATVGGLADIEAARASDPYSRQATLQIWPDFEARQEEIVFRRSVLRWPERITVPLLILQGTDDRQVLPEQSLRLASHLARLGRRFELHVIAGGEHMLSRHAAQRDAEIAAWFRLHAAPRED